MANVTVVVLSIIVALFAVGLLSTMTVLFTRCGDVITGKIPDISTDPHTVPGFFLPFSGLVRDSLVNGTQSEWMSEEGDYVLLGDIKTGRLLLQVDTTRGIIILRLVGLISLGLQDQLTFYINSGSEGFKTTDSGFEQHVWVRIVNDDADRVKINCMASEGFKTDWAFVATWILYEGSTFQVVFAFQKSSSSLAFFNYGQLNNTHSSNKFAKVEVGDDVFQHPDTKTLPINRQLIVNFSYGVMSKLEPKIC